MEAVAKHLSAVGGARKRTGKPGTKVNAAPQLAQQAMTSTDCVARLVLAS